MEFISNLLDKILFFNKKDDIEANDTEETIDDITRWTRSFSCSGRISTTVQHCRRRHTLYDGYQTRSPEMEAEAKETNRDGKQTFSRRSLSEPKITPLLKQKRKQLLYNYYSTNGSDAEETTKSTEGSGRRRSVSDSGVTSILGQERKQFLYNYSISGPRETGERGSMETGEWGSRETCEREEIIKGAILSERRRSLSGSAVTTTGELRRKMSFAGHDDTKRPDYRHFEFGKRRHSTAGLDSFVGRQATNRTRDGSVLDIVKEKLFWPENRRNELISETVARKLAKRKKEFKTLTRDQTIIYMKIKHNL